MCIREPVLDAFEQVPMYECIHAEIVRIESVFGGLRGHSKRGFHSVVVRAFLAGDMRKGHYAFLELLEQLSGTNSGRFWTNMRP